MKHYLVVGRVCYDDEDTAYSYFCDSAELARQMYREQMHEDLRDNGWSQEEVDRAEANGEGVFINGVHESDTPIKQVS